eukprot:444732_1
MSFWLILIIVCLNITSSDSAANPNLKWMSFYGWDPDNQHGWSYGTSGSIYNINQAYQKYKMQSLYQLPSVSGNISACTEHASSHPIFYWNRNAAEWYEEANACPDWSSNLKAVTSMIQPYIDNKTVIGYFIGDELVCHGVKFDDLTAIVDQIRGAAGNDIYIYENECFDSFYPNRTFSWKSIPDGLNWVSGDYYDMTDGTNEYLTVKQIYTEFVFPMLKKTKYGYNQQAVFVPGVFACNTSQDVMDENSKEIVIALNDMYSWAQNEPKLAGFNPWHFKNVSSNGNSNFVPKGCTAGADTLAPGAIAMPNVMENLLLVIVIHNYHNIKSGCTLYTFVSKFVYCAHRTWCTARLLKKK